MKFFSALLGLIFVEIEVPPTTKQESVSKRNHSFAFVLCWVQLGDGAYSDDAKWTLDELWPQLCWSHMCQTVFYPTVPWKNIKVYGYMDMWHAVRSRWVWTWTRGQSGLCVTFNYALTLSQSLHMVTLKVTQTRNWPLTSCRNLTTWRHASN